MWFRRTRITEFPLKCGVVEHTSGLSASRASFAPRSGTLAAKMSPLGAGVAERFQIPST